MEEVLQVLFILAILVFPIIKGVMTVIAGRKKEENKEQADRANAGLADDSLIIKRNTATGSDRPSPNRRSSRSQKAQGTLSGTTSLKSVQDSQATNTAEHAMISQPNVQSSVQHSEQTEHPIITLFRNQITVQQMIVAAEILKRPDFGHFGKHGKEDYSSNRPTF
ncbi:MAG: hypothetical protein ACRC10_05180 [Thermoguttaceae bacterium]